ncbi:MAG TPA: family 1 glycosylhydrolase [Sphingomicrobium sp.]|nr:family 1 glycosylhydrolase [Sphingomicrobium sp.]
MTPLELWGGVECTHVRIGDAYRDQLAETGHDARIGDVDAMASIGIKAVRYPILWEKVAPQSPDELDFSWHDSRLARLREHGIRVIAGLVHHGSGPRYTHLLEPDFSALLARFAGRVARRYPWIDAWTPINEPLTTARFAYLYGAWHPHRKDRGACLRAVVNQAVAIAEAMTAIRKVRPDAQLIATEDVGKTFATERLAYQADHENHRRWLVFDLLTGRVGADHYYYRDLIDQGVSPAVLDHLRAGHAAPDLLGFDHYLTSERFLDDRLARYPGVEPGGNGRDCYVDVEAVRIARLRRDLGPAKRLRELWDRYHVPIAITEAHHSCTREEQVRWFHEMWTAAEAARRSGIDVRAVTLWAMFGLVDWRSLLTRRDGVYDVGVFDVRGDSPRPTLLAKAASALGSGKRFDHPLLDLPGWWKRPGRCLSRPRFATLPRNCTNARPILITGATGTLGQAFGRICAHRGLAHVLTGRGDLDIRDPGSIAAAINRHRPWAVVNAAGFVRPGAAEAKADECFRVNATGPELLARACKSHGIPLVTFSSDLVFDGTLGRSYVESDRPAPRCAYGRSKAEAEARLSAVGGDVLIIRTSAFFGPWDRYNFLFNTIAQLKRSEEVVASDRTIVSPTYVPDLVHAALDLLLDEETGLWHLTNRGAVSWFDLAREVAAAARLPVSRIHSDDAAVGADTSLASARAQLLRPLDGALRECLESPMLRA